MSDEESDVADAEVRSALTYLKGAYEAGDDIEALEPVWQTVLGGADQSAEEKARRCMHFAFGLLTVTRVLIDLRAREIWHNPLSGAVPHSGSAPDGQTWFQNEA